MSLPTRQLDDIDRQAIAEGRAIYSAFRSLINGDEARRSNRAAASNQSDRSLPKHKRVSEAVIREFEKVNHAPKV